MWKTTVSIALASGAETSQQKAGERSPQVPALSPFGHSGARINWSERNPQAAQATGCVERMKFQVDGLTVYWPFEYCYPEQYQYMVHLKRALDAKKHGILEMPTGTGKTVTLLSFIVSYQMERPEISKLIYCTRTVGEISKVLEELRKVAAYRDSQIGEEIAARRRITALGLTTRRNLCLQDKVAKAETREEADSACREMTASWVRPSEVERPEVVDLESLAENQGGLCEFYEGFKTEGEESIIPPGIYTLDDMMDFGREKSWCPYYTARHALNHANVVVYNYQYLLDPKIAGLISSKLARESIVVFDEAHNIDTVCVDALSVCLREQTLRKSLGNLQDLSKRINDIKDQDSQRLQIEYERLVEGIASNGLLPPGVQTATSGDQMPAAPVIPQHIREETVPGNLRKSEHFVGFLRRIIGFLREKMRAKEALQMHPARLLQDMSSANLDERSLRFASERLKSLLLSLEVVNMAQFTPIQLVCDFTTLLGTYGHEQKFAIIYEPFDERLPQIPDQVMQLSCLDASLAIKPVFDKFQSVILTSGTISPLPLYATILDFKPVVSKSFTMSLNRRCILPMVVSRGADQIEMSSRYETRMDKSVIRNYGALLIEFSSIVPDGIVVFFTSYIYMETVIQKWSELDIINAVLRKKLVFIETPDSLEASLALENYRKACDSGRGAVFLCVARGKVAEGIDFDRHYGRCVIVMGVPFQYTESRVLKARLDYMREHLQVKEGDYLSFDAMRQASQCIGRVIRSKSDYGIMVLADKRFVRSDKKNKLPEWIQTNMDAGQVDLDTEMALAIARSFLRQMAQPLGKDSLIGTALLDEDHLREMTDNGNLPEARSDGLMAY